MRSPLGRYEAYGWHTQVVADGTDTAAIMAAVENAKAETGKPSIIKTKTIIGFGSQKQVQQQTAAGICHDFPRSLWGQLFYTRYIIRQPETGVSSNALPRFSSLSCI